MHFESLTKEGLFANADDIRFRLGLNRRSYLTFPPELQSDKSVALFLVGLVGELLEVMPTEFRSDKEIVLAAVRHDGMALIFAENGLRDDIEVASAAWKENVAAFEFASLRIRSDKNIALEIMSRQGDLLSSLSEELRDDKEIVLAAIANDGYAIHDASERLRSDKSLCLAAMTNEVGTVEEMPDKIRRDKHVMAFYLMHKYDAHKGLFGKPLDEIMSHFDGLENTKESLLWFMQPEEVLELANDELRDDMELVLTAINGGASSMALRLCSERLRNNPVVGFTALWVNQNAYMDFGDELKGVLGKDLLNEKWDYAVALQRLEDKVYADKSRNQMDGLKMEIGATESKMARRKV